jgi:lysophospholipase L1-like esterase
LSGAIDTAGYHKSLWSNYPDSTLPLSKVAIEKYQEVIQLSRENHIRLITVVSPFYFPFDFSNNSSFATIKKMMADNNFELYDFSHDTRFLNTASLFHDDIHLNDSGATIFTNEIIKIINHPR